MREDDFPYFLDCLGELAACYPYSPPLDAIAPDYFAALRPFDMTIMEEAMVTARRNVASFPSLVTLVDLAMAITRARAGQERFETLLSSLILPSANGH